MTYIGKQNIQVKEVCWAKISTDGWEMAEKQTVHRDFSNLIFILKISYSHDKKS